MQNFADSGGTMPKRLIGVNAAGFRVGQDNPNAVLTDHDVELLLGLLDARATLIDELKEAGNGQGAIETALRASNLSFGALAVTFEISKTQVRRIAKGDHRSQYPARFKAA